VQLSYTYDAMGRRTSKAVQGGTPTQFLYDGANAVQEVQGSTVNSILTGLGVDERFARNDATGRTYFLTDALNSTIALTDPTGAIREQYSYDPYGNVTPSDTTTGFTNPYQYTGREADTPGLYYYRARYYSPMMGGFISEDPAGFAGGQLTFYGYAGGDPADFNDPTGRFIPEAVAGLVVGAAWGYVSGVVSGDHGDQLLHDVEVGAVVGGLAGLTDGGSLLADTGVSAAWKGAGVVARIGINAAGEAARQKINYGCVNNLGNVALAGGLSVGSDLVGSVAGAIKGISGEELEGAASAANTAISSTPAGAAAAWNSASQYSQQQQAQSNAAWAAYESGMH
jgi:RHS repeat-associated protein